MGAKMNVLESFGIVENEIGPMVALEAIELEHTKEKRRARVERCGAYRWGGDPNTGRYRKYRETCKYWRLCEHCFGVRVKEFKERYQRCLEIGARVVFGEKNHLRKLRREGVEYWAVPTENGLVIIHEDSIDLGLPVTEPVWETLAMTPEGRRCSGSLGKEEKMDVETKVSISIPVRKFEFTGTSIPAEEVVRIAEEMTEDLDPDLDEEELRSAMWTKTNVLREVILSYGGRILDESVSYVTVTDKSYKRWTIRNKTTTKIPKITPEMMQSGFWNE